jgi:hypothetical protein
VSKLIKFLTYQSTFGSNEKLLEIKSTWRNFMRVHLVDDRSIWQNNLQSKAVGMHGALLDELDSTSVGSEVASDLARSLGSKIKWHHVTSAFTEFLKCLKNAASFTRKDTLSLIQFDDVVHLLGADDHLVVEWDGAANEAGVATLWHNGNHVLVAVLKASRNLLCGSWGKHDATNSRVFSRDVNNESCDFIFAHQDILFANAGFESVDVLI